MDRRGKILLTLTSIILIIVLVIKLLSDWITAVMEGKPNGPYHSSLSIEKAKKEKVWLGTFVPDAKKYYSADKKDSFELAEIWIEKNINDREIYRSTANNDYILTIFFKRLTEKDLHKFRLIQSNYNAFENVEHPDGYPRVRFLINEMMDTIRIEVLERNPKDSLAWETEKSMDTITLIRMN